MRPQFGSARLHLEAGFLVVSWRKCDILNAARTHLLSHLHESAKSESIAVQICLIGIMKWCHIRRCIPQQPDFLLGKAERSGFERIAHFFVQRDLLLLRPRICHNHCVIQHLPAGFAGSGGLVHGGVGAEGIAVDTVGVSGFEYVGLALDYGDV